MRLHLIHVQSNHGAAADSQDHAIFELSEQLEGSKGSVGQWGRPS